MISAMKIYIQGIKIAFASRMAYRSDFFISVTIMLLGELIVPLATFLVYKNGAAFPGWGFYEVLLIQAIFLISKGIGSPMFLGMIGSTLLRVREGTFDVLLIKPCSPLFMSIITSFDIEDLGKLIGGIGLFAVSLYNLPFPTMAQWIQFFLLMILSLMVLFSFTLIMAATVFKWVGNSRVFEIFDCITSFGLYPGTIFSKSLYTIITSIIPVALIGFLPTAVLLGKPSSGLFASCASGFIFLFVSIAFWNFMLKKYTSAGG